MHDLTTVATQVGVLFALMGVGAACRWFRLVDDGAMKGMVNVLILIVTPCLVVDVFQRPFERAALGALAAADGQHASIQPKRLVRLWYNIG